MKNFLNKIKTFITSHKTASVILLIVIIWGGYWLHGKLTSTTGETKYTLSVVNKGTVISSVSGSGQVSASNSIDLKPTVSGNITYVAVKPGDKVNAGKTLFSIDNTDAEKTVRDAEVSLQSSQLALAKLKNQNSDANNNANLVKAYDDGFNTVH